MAAGSSMREAGNTQRDIRLKIPRMGKPYAESRGVGGEWQGRVLARGRRASRAASELIIVGYINPAPPKWDVWDVWDDFL